MRGGGGGRGGVAPARNQVKNGNTSNTQIQQTPLKRLLVEVDEMTRRRWTIDDEVAQGSQHEVARARESLSSMLKRVDAILVEKGKIEDNMTETDKKKEENTRTKLESRLKFTKLKLRESVLRLLTRNVELMQTVLTNVETKLSLNSFQKVVAAGESLARTEKSLAGIRNEKENIERELTETPDKEQENIRENMNKELDTVSKQLKKCSALYLENIPKVIKNLLTTIESEVNAASGEVSNFKEQLPGLAGDEAGIRKALVEMQQWLDGLRRRVQWLQLIEGMFADSPARDTSRLPDARVILSGTDVKQRTVQLMQALLTIEGQINVMVAELRELLDPGAKAREEEAKKEQEEMEQKKQEALAKAEQQRANDKAQAKKEKQEADEKREIKKCVDSAKEQIENIKVECDACETIIKRETGLIDTWDKGKNSMGFGALEDKITLLVSMQALIPQVKLRLEKSLAKYDAGRQKAKEAYQQAQEQAKQDESDATLSREVKKSEAVTEAWEKVAPNEMGWRGALNMTDHAAEKALTLQRDIQKILDGKS